jgi:hypothetical protein
VVWQPGELTHVLPLEGEVRGLQVPEAKRLRQLEDENRKLKQIVADQTLDIAALKAVVSRKW